MRFRARTLDEALSVLQQVNRIMGVQCFEYRGETLRSISLVYGMSITVFYWFLVYHGYDFYLNLKIHRFERLLASFIMYLHGFTAFVLSVCGCVFSKAYKRTMGRIDKVDSTLEQLSSATSNQGIWVMSISGLVCYVTYQLILHYINESFVDNEDGVVKTAYAAVIYIHCQNLSYGVVFTFVSLIISLRERFKRINDLLAEILAAQEIRVNWENIKHHSSRIKILPVLQINPMLSGTLETNGVSEEDRKEFLLGPKRLANRYNHTIRTTRQLHLELCKTSRALCSYFGFQLLLIILLDVVVITNVIFTLYNSLESLELSDTVKSRRIFLTTTISVLHACQLAILNVFCNKAAREASKTTEMIHALGSSMDDPETKEEIRQFALQTMQRPLEFWLFGFLLLDNKFLDGLVELVTTYVVILIQVGGDWRTEKRTMIPSDSQTIRSVE